MASIDSSSVEFFKLSGAGNDFIALAEPEQDPSSDRIAAWCRRGLSVGADGLFVLRRIAGDGPTPRVAMTHYNADGGRAELCFNGARCAARLAFHLGWAKDRVDVETEAGALSASPCAAAGSISIEAPVPAATPRPLRLSVAASGGGGVWREELEAWHLVVGVPHLVVIATSPLAALDLARLGPPLRRHADLGPAGANVNFVSFAEPHALDVRTWERGVEGETLACGSGILASARVGLALGALSLPVEVRTAGGRPLRLSGTAEAGVPVEWRLEGDARIVATGTITDEAR